MRVLVACEESQRVCIAFRERGHEAYSCDIIDCSGGHPEWHIKDDVLKHLNDEWDLMIAHPPCTYLANAGLHYLNTRPERKQQLEDSFKFVKDLWNAPINKICIENPVGWLNTHWQKPTQIIQPYYFGKDEEIKTTCLWLKHLQPLVYFLKDNLFYKATSLPKSQPCREYIRKSGNKEGQVYRDYWHSVGSAYLRSKTFIGIAKAMASQWSEDLTK